MASGAGATALVGFLNGVLVFLFTTNTRNSHRLKNETFCSQKNCLINYHLSSCRCAYLVRIKQAKRRPHVATGIYRNSNNLMQNCLNFSIKKPQIAINYLNKKEPPKSWWKKHKHLRCLFSVLLALRWLWRWEASAFDVFKAKICWRSNAIHVQK